MEHNAKESHQETTLQIMLRTLTRHDLCIFYNRTTSLTGQKRAWSLTQKTSQSLRALILGCV
jgi:hypothetical protein